MNRPLNFGWDFLPDFSPAYLSAFPKDCESVDLPHSATLAQAAYHDEESYQRLFTYGKTFELEASHPYLYLNFEGVMVQFDLYLNGEFLGHFVSGYLPVRVDVSKSLKVGKNRLIVVVDGREDPLIPPFGGEVDYLTGAGIYRGVYLETHDGPFVEDLFVEASASGLVSLSYTIQGEGKPTFQILDGKDQVASFAGTSFRLDNAKPYSLKDPHLYTLRATIGDEVKEVAFGCRDIAWTEEGFFLNGEKVFLRGLNRHQLYPYVYGAMPAFFQKEDARILKQELGCNIVRTSHYPQSEDFLNECDRLGLLVIDEIPGWQHIGKEPKWRDQLYDFTKRMIVKERNHPSLIAYGLRIDESGDDHELYSKIQEIKQSLDPKRASLGVRNFKESECLEDIYAYNDFSCNSLSHGVDDPSTWSGAKGKVKLITESNGHMYPTASYDSTDVQLEHALRHARVLDDAMGKKGLVGALSWCAFDYPTHETFGNLDHICHHGVMDQYRGKKPAAYFYASQSDENPVCYLASSLQSSDYPAALLPPAVVFTNADEIDLFIGEEKIGTFYPDRKHYPNLIHPPVILDDWIGERFKEEKISAKDRKTIVEGLNFSAHYGFDKLPFRLKFKMGLLMMKYHYSFTDVYNLYGKYINHWGSGKKDNFILIAKKDGQEVSRQEIVAPRTGETLVSVSKSTLVNGDTYDGTYLTIEKRNEYGYRCHKAFDPFLIEVEGPLRLLGPKMVSLEGGFTSIGIASTQVNKPTVGRIKVTGNNFEKILEIEVR